MSIRSRPPSSKTKPPMHESPITPRIKLSPKFQTYPPKEDLLKMTIEQLSDVEDFRIWNNHGEIIFLENVDLR